jgi:hypothetical protein
MEETEELLVRNFLSETIAAARDLGRINHTLAPGKETERGFDLPGGGLWTDTMAAMRYKVEHPAMSDEDVERHTAKLLAQLDVRKAEDLLYLTEEDWRQLDLPVSLAFLKDRLLRYMMDHKSVGGMHRASFFTAQQSGQRPVERFKNLNFADQKASAYTASGVATAAAMVVKGEQHEIPNSQGQRSWVVADCFQSEELDPFDLVVVNRGGSKPTAFGWPRGWPYIGTDVGPRRLEERVKAVLGENKHGHHEERGSRSWEASVKSMSRSSGSRKNSDWP